MVVFAAFSTGCNPPPATSANAGIVAQPEHGGKHIFVVGNSRFVRLNSIEWVEERGGGPSSDFDETDRTPAYVQLYDKARRMAVRLFEDHGEWYERRSSRWYRWTNENGAWVAGGDDNG